MYQYIGLSYDLTQRTNQSLRTATQKTKEHVNKQQEGKIQLLLLLLKMFYFSGHTGGKLRRTFHLEPKYFFEGQNIVEEKNVEHAQYDSLFRSGIRCNPCCNREDYAIESAEYVSITN